MFSTKDKFCNFCGVQWSMPGVTPESKIYEEARANLAAGLVELIKPDHPYFTEL
jgi:hypothetical protein